MNLLAILQAALTTAFEQGKTSPLLVQLFVGQPRGYSLLFFLSATLK